MRAERSRAGRAGKMGGKVQLKAIRAAGRRETVFQAGFTVIELSAVLLVMGILLGVASLNFSQVSSLTKLSGAKRQVEEAIERAKTSARQENVTYRIHFYSSDEAHPNTFEFYRNTPESSGSGTTWSMRPVDGSVTGESVTVEGEGLEKHYYVRVAEGAQVQETVCIMIRPYGVDFRVWKLDPYTGEIVDGQAEVRLRVGRSTATVAVDGTGRTTVH